ncbi:MAG: hypothetical protein ACREDY_14215, partial [Bradyrhizobium sp.]
MALFALEVGNARGETWLHSDLPIESKPTQTEWPQGCSHDDVLAMCSRFALGDWQTRDVDCFTPICTTYVRLSIFSVIDGHYTYAEAGARQFLGGHGVPAAIIKLESGTSSGLYAIQVG